MESLSIINWELHQKIVSKHSKISKTFNYGNHKSYLESEYLNKNKKPFSVQNIDTLTSTNVLVLECFLNDRKKYFIDVETYYIYDEYPFKEKLNDEPTIYWIIKSIYEFLVKEEEKINSQKDILKEIIKNNI